MRRTAPGLALACALALALAGSTGGARAQDPALGAHAQGDSPGVPDVPHGDGTIAGHLVHEGAPTPLGDLPVVLYSLGEQGPGLREGRSDADGSFRFEGVSSSPQVVYLVGARYRGVPFGRRAVFGAGQKALDVAIPVSDPVLGGQTLRIAESEVRIDWMGAALVVQELHRVENQGKAVVYVPQEKRDRAEPVFTGALPEGARDFGPSLGTFGDSLERRGERVLYWGPLYPGPQEIGFRYELGAPGGLDAETLPLQLRFPNGAERLSVLVPESGPKVEIPGLEPGEAVERDGRRYRVLEAENLAKGARYAGRVSLPPLSHDASALSLPRTDVWVEYDDTALLVSQEHRLQVDGSAMLAGSPETPLLHLDLPPGARLMGVSAEAEGFGIAPSAGGGLDVLGPLPPGESSIVYRYDVPVEGGTGHLELHFPKEVGVLNVLVADSGVVIRDQRLHRRRPFHSGTRTYLHREAFQVEPSETVSIALSPLDRPRLPRAASLAVVGLAALAGAFFLGAPLRPSRGEEEARDLRAAALSRERESVVESLRDLDDDFETGKLAAADYERMRAELRARALELLRLERERAREPRRPAPPAAAPAAAPPPDARDAGSTPIGELETRVVRLCPACHGPTDDDWRFCSHCGAPLAGGEERESAG
jgi:hypothetical protein